MSDVTIQNRKLPEYIQKWTDDFSEYVYSSEHALLGSKGLEYNLTQRGRKLKERYAYIEA
jgi:hypothetical protein